MKRRILVLLSLLLAAGQMFAGGSTQSSGQGGQTQSDAPRVVRIQGYGGQDPAIVVRLIDEVIGQSLSAENIEIVYEPIEGDYNAGLFNALSAGTAGDIIYIPVETAPGIIASGSILPLNGRFNSQPFIDSLLDPYTVDGQIYGIPKDFNTLAIYYNKDLFDEANVPYPTENETWTSLADKARKISALGPDVFGIAFQPAYDRFGAFALGTGWDPFDSSGKTNLQDPKFVQAFTWYTDLIKEGAAVTPTDLGQGWTGGAFATEQVGMALEGAWMIGFLNNEAPNIPYGTAFLPAATGGQVGNFIYTVAYGINKNSSDVDAALKVLDLLTNEAAQQFILENGLAIPSRESLANNPYFNTGTPAADANKTIFLGAAKGNVQGYQFGSVGTEWMNPINTALTAVATGQASVEQALATAQQEIEQLF